MSDTIEDQVITAALVTGFSIASLILGCGCYRLFTRNRGHRCFTFNCCNRSDLAVTRAEGTPAVADAVIEPIVIEISAVSSPVADSIPVLVSPPTSPLTVARVIGKVQP